MSPFRLPRTGAVRRCAVLLGSALALALLPVAGASAALASSPGPPRAQAAQVATDSRLTASIAADSAGILAPGQDLGVSVTVTNPSATAYLHGAVSLWIDSAPQKSRSSLTTWLESTDPDEKTVTIGQAAVGVLEPGTSTVVRVTVPSAALPFAASATEAVFGIGATATMGPAAAATARDSIIWSPGPTATPSMVGVVLPVVSPSTANGVLSAVDLATYTAPNGVLTRDLDGLDGLPKHTTVALGIDPMIIASIRVLGNAAPASARQWLQRLAALPNDTFSLGFGDADVTGQLQSGLTKLPAPTSLDFALDPKNFTPSPTPVGEPATVPADTAVAATPGPTPTAGSGPVLPTLAELTSWNYTMHGIAWPGDGTVRSADLSSLVASGFTTTIASGGNSNAKNLDQTPNAVLPFNGGKLAVADAGLSDAIRQAASAPSDVAWNAAMAKVNAQLELTSKESGGGKHLLVSFDRSWPSSGTQLQRTLDALLSSPWSAPATLPETLASSATAGLALADAAEPQARITRIKELTADEAQLDQFSTITDKPERMTGRARAQLLTLLAVSWQNPRNDWAAAVSNSHTGTVGILTSVKIVPTENVNLVSAQGSIPFTVSNGLSDESVNLVLRASPSNSRLEIDEDATKRILPESRGTMLVPVKAKLGNGQVTLSLHLYSPTGVSIGVPSSVKVDVHADWEGIGALIFGILVVLLFGFGVVRNILRRRERRSTPPESPKDAANGADETEDTARG